ncbi:MAG TPA: acyltransferase family protein, partial [Pseudonocardiaceae bacterium]
MSTTTTRISASPATGRGRDPFIDLLRVGAIAVVVLGHWIMPVLAWRPGTLVAGNVLTTPGWWILTWVAQVMPVFFIAGGAANYHSYTAELRRGGTARDWLAARIRRLATPVVPLLAVWLVVPGVLRDVGVPGQPVAVAASTVGQLLWFLAVYL